jgi:hypothetical protein
MLEVRGSRKYYYRYVKSGGRSRRVYVAANEAAEEALQEDARRRAEREAAARAWRAEQQRHTAATDAADELAGAARDLAHAALLLAGFRLHHRSEWRRAHAR